MFRSITLGKIAGIDIKLHATFAIWLLFVLFDPAYLVHLPIVFSIVVLHELGHALTARRLGIQTRDILLTPIGGIASLTRMPRRPQDELLITAAGPAVNVVLAALTWPFLSLATGLTGVLLELFFMYNVVLAAFNLIPAFPMDGGRLLRAFLTMRSGDYAGSTRTAAKIGRAMAWVLGLGGLFTGQLTLCFIGVFVWFAASMEEASVNGGVLGALYNAAARRQQPPPQAPRVEVVQRPPTYPRRPSMIVDAEYTVV